MWPALGSVTWRDPGIFSAIAAMTSGEDMTSSSERGRVPARAHGTQGGDGPVRGGLQDDGADLLDQALVVVAGVGGEEAVYLQPDEDPHPFVDHAQGRLLARRPDLVGVGVGTGAGENEAGDPLGKGP